MRVCIAGLGRRGLDQIEVLSRWPGEWEVAAVCDRSPAAHARLQALHYDLRVPFVRDPAELMLFDPGLVLVSTTAPGHVPVAMTLIEAGYEGPLLVEKPLASSVAAARLLQAVDRILWAGVCFQRRCSAMYAAAVDVAYALGPVRSIAFASSGPEPVGMIGSHWIDLAGWFAGAPAASVSARLASTSRLTRLGAAFADPAGRLEVGYANGVSATIDLSGSCGGEGAGLEVVCERGAVRVPASEACAFVGERTIPADGGSAEWFEATLRALTGGGGPAPCTLGEALDGLEVLAGAFLSSGRCGEPVALPLGPDDAALELPIA
jgi:predicted dehydrogenase